MTFIKNMSVRLSSQEESNNGLKFFVNAESWASYSLFEWSSGKFQEKELELEKYLTGQCVLSLSIQTQ